MKVGRFGTYGLAVLVMSANGTARAAPLDRIEGPVSVNRDGAFQGGYKTPAELTDSPAALAPDGVDGTTLAVGAVVVGGAIAAIFFLNRDKRDRPASP
jgi:hypothetical protein